MANPDRRRCFDRDHTGPGGCPARGLDVARHLRRHDRRFDSAAAVGAPAGLTVLLLTYFANLSAGLTHYGTTPAPIYFGTGYVTQKRWWTVGFIASVMNILIWSIVGLAWWKVLGWW